MPRNLLRATREILTAGLAELCGRGEGVGVRMGLGAGRGRGPAAATLGSTPRTPGNHSLDFLGHVIQLSNEGSSYMCLFATCGSMGVGKRGTGLFPPHQLAWLGSGRLSELGRWTKCGVLAFLNAMPRLSALPYSAGSSSGFGPMREGSNPQEPVLPWAGATHLSPWVYGSGDWDAREMPFSWGFYGSTCIAGAGSGGCSLRGHAKHCSPILSSVSPCAESTLPPPSTARSQPAGAPSSLGPHGSPGSA